MMLMKHAVWHGVIFAMLLTLSTASFSVPEEPCDFNIRLQLLESEEDFFIHSLLKLSLSKTQKKICYTYDTDILTDARKTRHIEKGLLSLKWESAHSSEENALLRPVRIPIFRGLLGHRVFVIQKSEQYRFDKIESLEGLKPFSIGQGLFWADTKILKHAGLNVVTSVQGRNLWGMLNSERFDMMAIAIHEPWLDLENRSDMDLAVEENLILSYPSGLFFYTAPNNLALRDALERGMRQAMLDGSYDKLLVQSDIIKKTLLYARVSTRKSITIENPLLSTELLMAIEEFSIPLTDLESWAKSANRD